MTTNPSGRLSLPDNGGHRDTNKLLVLVPHETPHDTSRVLEKSCMLLPRIPKIRVIKDTVALIAHSTGALNMPVHRCDHGSASTSETDKNDF